MVGWIAGTHVCKDPDFQIPVANIQRILHSWIAMGSATTCAEGADGCKHTSREGDTAADELATLCEASEATAVRALFLATSDQQVIWDWRQRELAAAICHIWMKS